jgi:hypothetical protein
VFAVCDAHFTDRPQDEYRWRIFDVLEQHASSSKRHEFVLWNGDLTMEKDCHSARLTNRIADRMQRLHERTGLRSIISMGNHDYIDPSTPFFHFLRWCSFADFHTRPVVIGYESMQIMLLPHTRKPVAQWRRPSVLSELQDDALDFVFIHQSVIGSVTSSGYEMPKGVSPSFFDRYVNKRARIFAGDIHVPQQVGRVEYVGAPYPINLNDHFAGRVLEIRPDDKQPRFIETEEHFPRRRTIELAHATELNHHALRRGDQVRIRLQVSGHDDDWSEQKRLISCDLQDLGVELMSFQLVPKTRLPKRATRQQREQIARTKSDPELLQEFANTRGLDSQLIEDGLELVKRATA